MNKKVILLVSLLSLSSCYTPSNNKGYVKIDFKFPQEISFTTKALSESKALRVIYYTINIEGEGLDKAKNERISKSSSDKIFFQEIPIGLKKIKVSAFDNSNRLLASAQTDIDIKAGQINKATLDLKEIIRNFKLKLNNIPADSYVYAEIKGKNIKIQEEVIDNQIEIKDIDTDKVDLKITAFSKDSTPLLHIEKSIDISKSESADINLDKISFPVFSLKNNLLTVTEELLGFLNKILVRFDNNKTPKMESLEILVNGKKIDNQVSLIQPICLASSDNITINVKAKDDNNDKINLYWGQVGVKSNSYQLKLESERTDTIYKSAADLGKGLVYLGFILTDRKSYTNPSLISFDIKNTGCK